VPGEYPDDSKNDPYVMIMDDLYDFFHPFLLILDKAMIVLLNMDDYESHSDLFMAFDGILIDLWTMGDFYGYPEPKDLHIDDGLGIKPSMSKIPLAGQNATVMPDAVSPDTAEPANAGFGLMFIGDVEILSSDPPLQPNEFMNDTMLARILMRQR